MTFKNNESIGTIDEPQIFTFERTTSTAEIEKQFSLKVKPNPFRDKAHVSFELPQADEISIKMVDIMGNLVRYQALDLAAGKYNIILEANDADGNPLADGVYFIMLEGSSGNASEKVLLVK